MGLSFALGDWSNERKDGTLHSWKPSQEMVSATIKFAIATNRWSDKKEERELSPYLQFLLLSPTSLNEASEASRAFRERIHENKLHANERSIQQYGKQRAVKSFKVGESVSVAVSALDHASTDDKRIFGQAKQVHNGPSYEIQTKYGILDRNFPTSELMPLPSTIDLEIPVPAPDRKKTLHAIAAQESTTDKVPVFCKCKTSVVGAQLESALVLKQR